jgi:glucose-6-phosphate isomerase
MFEFWDWVGGRYSLWSAIGLSLMIAIGPDHFADLLAGAHEMDEHFRTAPLAENLPATMALLSCWYRDALGAQTHAVVPYAQALGKLPSYLQQLEMESNGKSVNLAGESLTESTAPVIWGEPGNNAQHSFFQLLHQGTPRAALDFLLPAQSSCGNPEQATLAIANCLAQADAFAFGYNQEQAVSELKARKVDPARIELLSRHKVHAGNRPASIVAFERLNARTLGSLIALYEHKVFTQSVIWGINAFDQWGVELGKRMCEEVLPMVRDGAGMDARPMLKPLLGKLRAWKS